MQKRKFWTAFLIGFGLFCSTFSMGSQNPTSGLFPLWEGAPHQVPESSVMVSLYDLQAGLMEQFSLGINPYQFAYRSPNFYAKYGFFSDPSFQISGQLGFTMLLPGAADRFISPMYSSRINNPDFSVTTLESQLLTGWQISKWLYLSGTTTAMGLIPNGPFQGQIVPGQSFVLSFGPSQHTVLAHLGQVGLWDYRFHYYGFSYRYFSGSFEGRIGYFYRHNVNGIENAPTFNIGWMF